MAVRLVRWRIGIEQFCDGPHGGGEVEFRLGTGQTGTAQICDTGGVGWARRRREKGREIDGGVGDGGVPSTGSVPRWVQGRRWFQQWWLGLAVGGAGDDWRGEAVL